MLDSGLDELKVKQVLQIPDSTKVVGLTPIGYPLGVSLKNKLLRSAVASDKIKPMDEIIHK
jgi:hypothetical protein